MTESELTVSILRDIRDRLDQTNARLDQTNTRLVNGFSGVVTVLKKHDTRFAAIESQLKQLSGEVVIVGRYVKNRTEQIKNRTEKELRILKTRVTKLERKVG